MFSQAVVENLGYYVYFLRDPRNHEVFYVGKGTGNRVFHHLAGTLETDEKSEKLDRLREIRDSGTKVEHYILRHGLTEASAFEVEAALIDFIGLDSLTNLMGGIYTADFGMKTASEIIAQYEAAELVPEDPLILINLNRLYRRDMTPNELYEATRKWWIVGKRRENALYAVPHYRGLTREVYRIEGWHESAGQGRKRWAFTGRLAPEDVRLQYRYKSVKSYFKHGERNPIKYDVIGMKAASESIAQYEAAELVPEDPLILINLNRSYRQDMTPNELYEATRKSWVVGKRREKAVYAVPHYRGLTREVYRIEEWHPSGKRWAFTGRLAPEDVRLQYRYKSNQVCQLLGITTRCRAARPVGNPSEAFFAFVALWLIFGTIA